MVQNKVDNNLISASILADNKLALIYNNFSEMITYTCICDIFTCRMITANLEHKASFTISLVTAIAGSNAIRPIVA